MRLGQLNQADKMGTEGPEKIRWGMVEDEVCSDLREEVFKVVEEIRAWVPGEYPGICNFFVKYPSFLEGEVGSDLEIECEDVRRLIEGVFDYSCSSIASHGFSASEELNDLGRKIEGLQERFGFLLKLNVIMQGVMERNGEEECFDTFGVFRTRMIEKGHKPDANFFLNWMKVCKNFDNRKDVMWGMFDDGVKMNDGIVMAWFEMICKDSVAESEAKSVEISAWVAQARKVLKLSMPFFKDLLAKAGGSFSRVTIFEMFAQNGDWDRDEARGFFDYWVSLLDINKDSGEIAGISKIYKRRLERCGYDCFRIKHDRPPVRVRRRSSGRS